jgi:hypothetical protein
MAPLVLVQLRLGDVDLGLDDVLNAEGQIGHRDALFHAVIHAVYGFVVVAGEVQHGLAHGLRGDGAGVDTRPADDLAHFHEGHFLSELRPVNSGALPCRSGADDDQIVDAAHAR